MCCSVLLQRGLSFYWRSALFLQILEPRGRGLVRKKNFCFVNGNIFLFSAPRPCPAKGEEFLLALAKGEKCYWRRALLLRRRGIEDWGSYLCCSVLLQRGLSFYWRSALLLQIWSKGGGVWLGKHFSVSSMEIFFCYLHPKGNIFLFSTHISTLFNL